MKTVNLKSDLPQVHEALERLDRELFVARQEKAKLLKVVHATARPARAATFASPFRSV